MWKYIWSACWNFYWRAMSLLGRSSMNQFEGRAERINITMPKRLLNKIDTYVRNNPDYANRSAFLAEAARRVLPGV
ncbi:hypothetical protein DJICPGNB_17940 [Escherichia coli]|nr:hypothetical protein DJICPGNB_17940 [Escherichia coli]